MLSKFFNRYFFDQMAMDLGTANTLIFTKKDGVVLNEPSVVALNRETGKALAVGKEAKDFLGRTPSRIAAIRPMKDGVIADFDVTRIMIQYFLNKVRKKKTLFKPTLVIGVPSGITSVEKRAVIDSAEQAGARKIHLIEEPMAAAIGAGLEIDKPQGNMIVDIGGGTTEVAVISLFSTAYCESIRVAGDEMNEALIRYLQEKYHLLIGENRAEEIKMAIGSAYPQDPPMTLSISGKDLIHGIPKHITLKDWEVREAITEPLNAIIGAVIRAFEKTPPEFTGDISARGITLAGGGALLKGLDERISHETNLKVQVAQDPLTSVVMGAGQALMNMDYYRRIFIN
jgi:rod shape-determining protein MreB